MRSGSSSTATTRICTTNSPYRRQGVRLSPRDVITSGLAASASCMQRLTTSRAGPGATNDDIIRRPCLLGGHDWADCRDRLTVVANHTPLILTMERSGRYEPTQPIQRREKFPPDNTPPVRVTAPLAKITRRSNGIRLVPTARGVRCSPS